MLVRVLSGVALLSVALTVVFGGHYYIARRLVFDPAMPAPWSTLILAGIAAGLVSMFAAPFAERLLPRSLARWLAWPSLLWMGFAWIQICVLGLADAVSWLAGFAAADLAPTVGTLGVVAYATAAVAATLAIVEARGTPQVVRTEIVLDRWPAELDGFSIAQISDIHIGPTLGAGFARRLTERTNGIGADLIAVTGDLVDGPVRFLRDEVQPFAELSAPRGVFFVTGNHDYYAGATSWVDVVRDDLGWKPLRNCRVEVKHGTGVFDLAGVDDHRGGHRSSEGREDLPAALAGRDPARPVVLLAHDPGSFAGAVEAGVDLQISGHTHAGQIWPFRYLVRLVTPYVAGLYTEKRSRLYVSQGSGYWGPPMRLFTRSEIGHLVIRSPASL